jgi:hypothetical protein
LTDKGRKWTHACSTDPKLLSPSLQVVRYSGVALSEGIKVHRIERQPVRVYPLSANVLDVSAETFEAPQAPPGIRRARAACWQSTQTPSS